MKARGTTIDPTRYTPIKQRDRVSKGAKYFRGALPRCRYRKQGRCVKHKRLCDSGWGTKHPPCRSLLAKRYCPKGKGGAK